MWIKRLRSKNFRTYSSFEVIFDKGVNIIIGENGQGKTNFLESIHFAITGRSFRTEKLIDLIKNHQNALETDVLYEQSGIENQIKIEYSSLKKKILHNATTYPTLSSLTGTIPSIAIVPSDIELIMGAPLERRRFINLLIAQHDPIYLHQLLRYQKALKVRNILLKRNSLEAINVYETLLAQSAAYITHARQKTVHELSLSIEKEYFKLTQKPIAVGLKYTFESTPTIDYYVDQYRKHRAQEIKIGTTLIGPHRDDILFLMDHLEVKQFASEGQKRALLTALKLSELKMLKIKTNIDPILFIDDFAIHLDLYRCKLLEEMVQAYPQVFLTTPQNLFENGALYFVQERSIKKLNSALV